MKETLESRIANAKNLLDVLLILKESTMRDVHVSTLAYVKENIYEFDGTYSIWSCSPFPLVDGQSEYVLHAYCFTDVTFEDNAIVPILFTDRNFINNLNAVDRTPKQTEDTGLHLIKYGIILNPFTNSPEISGVVRYDQVQSLNDTQKSRARSNIGAGTYSKPANGIPASDLAAGVVPTVYVSTVNGDSGEITNVAKTNVDNAFSTTQTIYGTDDTPLNLRANHATWANIALFNSSGTRLGNIGANGYSPYWWGGQGNSGQIALISDIPANEDHYPTTFTWTDGDSAGPTGSLTGNTGFSAVSFGAIPSASSSTSGVVTTGAQTFAGNKTFSSTLYSSVNDINFIGTQGRIGFRAYMPGTTTNAGQMLITTDSNIAGSYRLSIQAYNKTQSDLAGSTVYNTFRMGDSEGLTYKIGSVVKFSIDDNGIATLQGLTNGTYSYTLPSANGTLALNESVVRYAGQLENSTIIDNLVNTWGTQFRFDKPAASGYAPQLFARSTRRLGNNFYTSYYISNPNGYYVVTNPAANTTISDVMQTGNWYKYLITNIDDTITARYTFSTEPIITGIYNTAANGTIAGFGYNSTDGTTISSSGSFIAYGDDDDSNPLKPTNQTIGTDIDTYYFNTGVTLIDSDGNMNTPIQLSFPGESGTLATRQWTLNQIPTASTLSLKYQPEFLRVDKKDLLINPSHFTRGTDRLGIIYSQSKHRGMKTSKGINVSWSMGWGTRLRNDYPQTYLQNVTLNQIGYADDYGISIEDIIKYTLEGDLGVTVTPVVGNVWSIYNDMTQSNFDKLFPKWASLNVRGTSTFINHPIFMVPISLFNSLLYANPTKSALCNTILYLKREINNKGTWTYAHGRIMVKFIKNFVPTNGSNGAQGFRGQMSINWIEFHVVYDTVTGYVYIDPFFRRFND